ncbi:MAG: alpha/beta fold hydrolase [Pseudomonadota bacterium]
MPRREINRVSLNIIEDGDGSETLVMLHGLLFSHRMFDAQIDVLKDRFRCVRMDFRGQGDSEVTPAGYDLDTLADDVIALIEDLGDQPVHLLGFSMGGMVAQRLALKRPELLRSLVLMNTAAQAEPLRKRPRFALLNMAARYLGLEKVTPKIMPLMFSDHFITAPECQAERDRHLAVVHANDRIGVTRAVHGVVSRTGVLDQIQQIKAPTLILTADQDRATPAIWSEQMQGQIPGSQLVMISDSGHMSTAEQPEAVNQALLSFYDSL